MSKIFSPAENKSGFGIDLPVRETSRAPGATPVTASYQQRAERKWWWAGTRPGRGCSSSWCGRWEACCGRMASLAAGPLWGAPWPERGRRRCPWSGWPKASVRLWEESPGGGGEAQQIRSPFYKTSQNIMEMWSIYRRRSSCREPNVLIRERFGFCEGLWLRDWILLEIRKMKAEKDI